MALSHGKILLGRFVLIFLLFTKLVFMYLSEITSPLLNLWPLIVVLLLICLTLALHMIEIRLFVYAWRIGKRHQYSYTWFGYTGLLIVDIMVVFAPHLLVVDAKQNIPFGPTVFVKVLCIAPFILLLFLNTAGEEGTEFHGESKWLFVTMSSQIFDAIDMIDNVSNGNRDGTPIGLGVGMITLAFGCLLLAALEFHELEHHSPGSENGARVYRLLGLILVNLATLIIRAVVYVDYGWRETTSVAKNIIVICTSVSELRRCIGQTSLETFLDEVQLTGPG